MKRTLFLIFAAAVASASTASVPDGEYLIVGNLKNSPDSTVVFLYKHVGRSRIGFCSDTVINGKFEFRDTVTVLHRVGIGAQTGKSSVLLWVAPGKRIEISDEDELWRAESDIAEQIEENRFLDLVAAEKKKIYDLVEQSRALRHAVSRDSKDDAQFVARARRKIDSLELQIDRLADTAASLLFRYMRTVPVTPVWMDQLGSYVQSLPYGGYTSFKGEMEELYALIPDGLQRTPVGKMIRDYLYPAPTVGVGDEMVDGDLYDLEGNLHRLAEFAGKYILLNFWAYGCGACHYSIPDVARVAEQYRDRLAVVSISIDSADGWRDFARRWNLTGIQWNECLPGVTGLAARYRLSGTPHYVLIAPDGRIRECWSGGYLPDKMKNMKL